MGVASLDTFWWPGGLEYDENTGLKPFLNARGLGQVGGTLLFLLSGLSALAMMVGYRASIAVPLVFASSLLQSEWNSLPLSSAAQVHRAVVFCLMWIDTGGIWSLDSRLRRLRSRGAPTDSPPTEPIWPLRLIRFQIALIYLSTGLWKLLNESWRDGSVLYYVVNDNQFHRFPPFLPRDLDWLWIVGSYATLLWELTFAFLLFHPWTRLVALSFGVAAHTTMWALLEVGSFSFVMLASYLAFLDPARVRNRSVIPSTRT